MSWKSQVIAKAKELGGELTFRHAQGDQPMKSMLGGHEETQGGVCRALVHKWMVMDAQGKSFWEWLCPRGKVNSAAVGNVMMTQISYGTVNEREAMSFDYLLFYGGLELTKASFSSGKNAGGFTVATPCGQFPIIGKLVHENAPRCAAYLELYMSERPQGHTLGAKCTDDGKVRYYDPNLGEIGFQSREGFRTWMETAFANVEPYKKYSTFSYKWYSKAD